MLSTRILLFTILSVFTTAQQGRAQDLQTNNDPMNVLIIMTDEHNFRTLGCYRETMEKRQAYMWGEAVVETPSIDWIAKNGAMCTSFYATTPVCSPSRGCLISGMYPQATPVTSNNVPLSDDVVTFAHVLGKQGYKTGFAGKWHLDGAGKPQWAPERNFGFDDNRFMFNRGHWKKLELTPDGPRVAAREGGRASYQVAGADEETFTTDFLTNRTLEFIDENKASPFCYMLSLPDPHGPDTVRSPYDTMFDDQEYTQPESANKPVDGLPSWGRKNNGRFAQNKYYGMIRCIDDNVGRILEKLKSEGLLKKTIIVFTSDHGDLRGEHHRQNKGVPYEGSTRVPFLIYAPGHTTAGSRIDQALTSVDFMPTLLKTLGVKHPPVHGRDFTDLLNINSQTGWQDIAFVRGTGTERGWLMAVTDRYKLVISSQDDPWLFDLQRDPDEVVNQFANAAYLETAQNLASELKAYCEKFRDPFLKNQRIAEKINWSIEGKSK